MCADAWDATLSRDAARDRHRHGEREPRRGGAGRRRHTPGHLRRGSLVATSWLQHSAGKELLGAWREMNPRLPGLAADVLEQDQRDILLGDGQATHATEIRCGIEPLGVPTEMSIVAHRWDRLPLADRHVSLSSSASPRLAAFHASASTSIANGSPNG